MDSFRQLKGQWDRAAAVGLTVAGGALLILGWFGVSGQGLTAEQIPYVVSGGLGGIFLMGVGAALWLSADLRDEWSKLDRIETVLERGLDQLGLGRSAEGRPTLAPLERDSGSAVASPQVAADERPTQTTAATGTMRRGGRIRASDLSTATNGAEAGAPGSTARKKDR